jgi:predicted TIM-barrel fold metal-dependent hydrolase
MSRPPFTDSHVHFYDMRAPELRYSWLEPGGDPEESLLGGYAAIRAERYAAEDYLAETRFHRVERVIHVQAAIGTPDPVEETRWLQAAYERTGIPHGIVGDADLGASNAQEMLERHLEHPNFRGIRDQRYDGSDANASWERGFAFLGKLGLVCCSNPALEHVQAAARLASRHTNVTFCVDHALFPRQRDPDYFDRWRKGVRELASIPSTVVKISGLGMFDHRWTVESIRPWVLACIEEFGVDRAFFGTNWPVDRLYSSYGDVLDAYAKIIRDFSAGEQAALFSDNAKRIFKLD